MTAQANQHSQSSQFGFQQQQQVLQPQQQLDTTSVQQQNQFQQQCFVLQCDQTITGRNLDRDFLIDGWCIVVPAAEIRDYETGLVSEPFSWFQSRQIFRETHETEANPIYSLIPPFLFLRTAHIGFFH